MTDSELDPLNELLSVLNESDEPEEIKKQVKNKEVTDLNEDEFFLSKIAAHELKVLKSPPQSTKTKLKLKSANLDQKPVKQKINLSLIHTGETDSSDDEDNKDYQNTKYNESGREIKHLLPENKKSEYDAASTWKKKTPAKFESNKVDFINEPFFGMRISKPLISNAVLQERMAGRAAISMARVKNFVAAATPNQDWVIAGAIVQKSVARTSQKGAQYIIWTLSDLQNDLQTVSLFLFRSAYKELWKTVVGTVIGVLNPSILENKDGSKHQATLSVDNHQKVMIFGHAKDYGTCKTRKKDGEQCTNFVNTNKCTFCIYHVKQEYQKCSIRSDLQSTHSGGGLTSLRNKVLGKNEVFYAGKSYMAVQVKKSKKLMDKDDKTLNLLNNKGVMTSAAPVKKKKGAAASFDATRAQRMKDLQMLQKLNGISDIFGSDFVPEAVSKEVSLEESKKTALEVIAKLKAKKTDVSAGSSEKINPNPEFVLFKDSKPKLTHNGNFMIDLNKPLKKPDRAKLTALQWVQQNGPIKKDPPKSGVKRFLENQSQNPTKKLKLDEPQVSQRFRKIMELTSKHADLLEKRDNEEQEKYFNKLEMREKLEEKMMSTYKMQCKAVKCLTCKYTSFSAAERCKTEKHPLKVFDAMKRFFKCGNCGNRTVSLEICPLVGCKQCGGSKWERTTMMKEKKVHVGEALSIRGGEQTFVNSVITDANINLMMPDD